MKLEDVAHWYIRLNGFFTITNFVVHPSRRGAQLTDGDIVGVRFPHRREFPDGPGADDEIFRCIKNRPYFLLAEVKKGLCELNQAWKVHEGKAVAALLQDLGPFPESTVQQVVSSLLRDGIWDSSDNTLYSSLLFIGTTFDPKLPCNAHRRSWDQIFGFMYERFSEYRRIKADHEQWDPLGQELWSRCSAATDRDAFIANAKVACDLK